MRQFYLGRNSSGYYRVYFIDPVTGLRDSGKSTHTKDKVEATMIATSWLQNGAPECRSNSRSLKGWQEYRQVVSEARPLLRGA